VNAQLARTFGIGRLGRRFDPGRGDKKALTTTSVAQRPEKPILCASRPRSGGPDRLLILEQPGPDPDPDRNTGV